MSRRNRQLSEPILQAALALARADGWPAGISRASVAAAAGVADSTVSLCWGPVAVLKEAVMQRAVTDGDLVLIAQGLAYGSQTARDAPEALRREALASMMGIETI